MRKKLIVKSLIVSTLLLSTAHAKDINFIEIGGGFNKTTDSFVASDDMTSAENSSTQAIPNIKFAYNVELSQSYMVYIKSQYGKFDLGSSYKINNSKIAFGFIMDMVDKQEWQNPFNRASNNDKTDVSEKGMYLSYSMPINENLYSTIKYQHTNKEYDNDQVIDTLKREGTKDLLSLKNTYKEYIANLNYEIYNANGEASSYKAYEVQIGKRFNLSNKLAVVALSNIGKLQYNEINPELNTKIDAITYGLNMQFKYQEPFNFKNSYVSFNTGIDKEDASHDFYDKENIYGMLSIGYKF